MRIFILVTLLLTLPACGQRNAPAEVGRSAFEPTARWDHLPQGEKWTQSTLSSLQTFGRPLIEEVPGDIATYCPAYPSAGPRKRAAFWTGLLSALAKHESTWRPDAEGGGGRWIGLVQIAPATARGYGCKAQSVKALKNGSANLACAVRIMANTVPRDGVVSRGGGGVAADWGPFHSQAKRQDIINWTRSQSYCQ